MVREGGRSPLPFHHGMHGTAGLLSVICDNGVTVFVFLVRAKWIGGGAALFNCFVSPTWFSQQIGAGERVGERHVHVHVVVHVCERVGVRE